MKNKKKFSNETEKVLTKYSNEITMYSNETTGGKINDDERTGETGNSKD